MKKNKIIISIFAVVCVLSTIIGYNSIKQNKSHEYDQLAVMLKQNDGTYIRSNMSMFGNDDYEFDHAVCNNGTTVTANPNGGVNLKLLGTDKCTVYLSLKPKTVIEKIKKYAKESTSSMYSKIEPTNEISSVTDDNFSKEELTYAVDTTHQSYYMTYADTYILDTSIPGYVASYTLTNPQVAKYSDIFSSLAGKYVVNYEGHNSSTAALSDTIDRIYKIVRATATEVTYIPSSYTAHFTNETTGVYTAEDDYGTSYFFRGNITNNYVKFGKWTEEVYRGYSADQSTYKDFFTLEECQANETWKYGCNKSPVAGKDMYWRIVRLNGDGSLRLMYDGTEAYANGTKSLDRGALTYRQYNSLSNNNAYVGYMYGDINGTTYDAVHANKNSSEMKKILEKWYEKNFAGTEYESKISDTLFCNDRSVASGTGIGTTVTQYKAYNRLYTNKSPSLVCPQKHDAFTVNDTTKGNGDLTYPIGLLTADEAALAGGLWLKANRGYFINKCYYMYLNSSFNFNEEIVNRFHVNGYGLLSNSPVNYGSMVVPVINLKAEYVNKLVGSGTMKDPYKQPLAEKIKASAKESISSMYSAVEPTNEISDVTDDNFSKNEQTYTVDATHQSYYITYADGYTFNTPTTAASGTDYPTYTLTSPQVAQYSTIYGSLAGKYIVNYEGHNSSTAAKSASIDRIYKVVSATATSITYIPSSYTTTFKNNGTTGVYTAQDENNTTSYYFRGNVTNNYVKFGKWTEEVYRGYKSDQSTYKDFFTPEECQGDGTYNYGCNKSPVAGKDMYWRIVRINGDGTLRLMYDGTEAHANGTKNLDRFALPYQRFNTNNNNNAYVGYMYGDINGTTYEAVHANTNPSLIKTALETWYEKNFVGTAYDSKIGDISFCNDRSLSSGTGIGTTETTYGAYRRLYTNKTPNLTCPKKNDAFTVNDTTKGNGDLTYPIGLLTADEVALAGGVYGSNGKNRDYYINKGYAMRLISPFTLNSSSDAFIGNTSTSGGINSSPATAPYGVTPVINLTAEYANQLRGSGTIEDPYTVK